MAENWGNLSVFSCYLVEDTSLTTAQLTLLTSSLKRAHVSGTDKTLTFLKVGVCLLTIKYLLSGSIKIPMSIRIIIALLLILDDIIRLVKVQIILSQVRHPEKLSWSDFILFVRQLSFLKYVSRFIDGVVIAVFLSKDILFGRIN